MRDEVSHLRDRTSELTIGLISTDFSLIHDLTREFSSRDVTFILYGPGDEIADDLDSLIIHSVNDIPEMNVSKMEIVEAMEDASETADRAIAAGMGRSHTDQLIIGIDPGARPGIAFIADSLLIKSESASEISGVRSIIDRSIRAYHPEKIIIRIGRGDPENRDEIIDFLNELGHQIEIVDERMTTRGTKFRDQNAAIRIARDPGDRLRDS